ncbi:MAG: hypothetical protein PHY12_06170 [Eubacteriales bacterium]|nr:hypothetical protein [Eubacteriales bacterium]
MSDMEPVTQQPSSRAPLSPAQPLGGREEPEYYAEIAPPYAAEADVPDDSAFAPDANPYARRSADAVSDLSARFAPPPKFDLPQARVYESPDSLPYAPATPNVYQPRQAAQEEMEHTARRAAYRVEPERQPSRKRRRHPLRMALIVAGVIAVLGGSAYLGRDWLKDQLSSVLGQDPETAKPTEAALQLKGYDPAPALAVSEKARIGISAVTPGLELETWAVTGKNVVARAQTGEALWDYYLFSSENGQLLGYYEGLGASDFLVLPGDAFYVPESPYLLNAQGLPLIDASRYQQAAGADAVLGPMQNGWALITRADGSACNFINASGDLISQLWFVKAFPFTGSSTLAYVDTGNVADPDERYTLYELSAAGETKLWAHAADTEDVVGSACGAAWLKSGELRLLDGQQTVLVASTDDVRAYVDCGALVVRDPATGLYALFVDGEQHYDFAYSSIEPAESDLAWTSVGENGWTLYTMADAAYPQPLSHYFALRRESGQEMVALSTTSVFPVRLF